MMFRILKALRTKVHYHQVFHELGRLHPQTEVIFNHSIINSTYANPEKPVSSIGCSFITVVYPDGKEKSFDDVGWRTFGKGILKNCVLLEIKTLPKNAKVIYNNASGN